MNKPKLLLSTWYPIFNSEGTSVRVKRVLKTLKSDFDVHVVTSANKDRDCCKKKLHVLKPEKSVLWPLKLVPIILDHNFEIVICENDWFGFPVYWLFSKIKKYKLVFEAHGVLSAEGKDWGNSFIMIKFYMFIEKFCLKHSDLIIALSNEIKKEYESYNSNIVMIPVFLNNKPFNNLQKNLNNSTNKTIGLVGPFGSKRNRYYAPDFLYKNIDKFDKSFNFVIVGKCEKKVKNSRISYSGYLKSFDEYINLIASIDALLVIEKRKTSGPLNKILEAMACCTPVFTTPKGIFGLENVKNGENIIVANESELINKINTLLCEDEIIKKITENAKRTFESFYSYENNHQKIVESLKTLLLEK
ncbi:MAG TPA: hypothetical protein DD434_09920 [Bacteroidales bacterium]|jgi:glycosyltransferase involved in cell wall biosynthesis|nr:hypothetical protein [Bacteroidales bacterium]